MNTLPNFPMHMDSNSVNSITSMIKNLLVIAPIAGAGEFAERTQVSPFGYHSADTPFELEEMRTQSHVEQIAKHRMALKYGVMNALVDSQHKVEILRGSEAIKLLELGMRNLASEPSVTPRGCGSIVSEPIQLTAEMSQALDNYLAEPVGPHRVYRVLANE